MKVINMKKMLVYETVELGKVKKVEKAKVDDIVLFLTSRGMSEADAKERVEAVNRGDDEGILIREIWVKRRVIEGD